MCKCANRNAFTHPNIHAKVPPVGLNPEASNHAAQNVTQHTKYESSKPKILNIYRSRRSRIRADLAHFAARSVRSVGIRIDLADRAHFRRGRWGFSLISPISPIFGEIGENGGNSHRSQRARPFSARSMRILAGLTDLAGNR